MSSSERQDLPCDETTQTAKIDILSELKKVKVGVEQNRSEQMYFIEVPFIGMKVGFVNPRNGSPRFAIRMNCTDEEVKDIRDQAVNKDSSEETNPKQHKTLGVFSGVKKNI